MSKRTIEEYICDRSGRFVEPREAGRHRPDLFVAAPWIPTLGHIVDADEGGARAQTKEAPAAPGVAIFDDLGNRDRLVVAKIIARLLKVPEAKILNAARARDGRRLMDAVSPHAEETAT